MEWRSSDDHVTGGGVPYVDYWSGGESTVRYDDETIIQDCGEDAESKHIARQDPARALAEVAAKRAIIATSKDTYGGPPWEDADIDSGEADAWDGRQTAYREVLLNLASAYSSHPDYPMTHIKWISG